MPSPFPGIDPYLESQGYWPDFHASLILYCRDALNDILPEHYEARLGEQLRLVDSGNPRSRRSFPTSRFWKGAPGGRTTVQSQAGVLTLEPVTIDLPIDELEEVRDVWIEIRRST